MVWAEWRGSFADPQIFDSWFDAVLDPPDPEPTAAEVAADIEQTNAEVAEILATNSLWAQHVRGGV